MWTRPRTDAVYYPQEALATHRRTDTRTHSPKKPDAHTHVRTSALPVHRLPAGKGSISGVKGWGDVCGPAAKAWGTSGRDLPLKRADD